MLVSPRFSALVAAGLAGAMLLTSAHGARSASCKPGHFRAPVFIKTMGACNFDPQALRFAGTPVDQAMCLMRGMDRTRNLVPPLSSLPPALAQRIGTAAGLPPRQALSVYLSDQDLEWDFAAYLWQPLSRGNDNDPAAPMARYFVIHDTSGPNYGHRGFPGDINTTSKINDLRNFECADGWGKAHVVVNRDGAMLVDHEFSVPWRETKFEQAANFNGALKGLFLHVEMIQPRRSASGHRWSNDAQSPDPAFTAAQYDRLALLYVIASVRAGQWLVPAFHAAIDAELRNGHDDPLNFNIDSFAASLDRTVTALQGPEQFKVPAEDASAAAPAPASPPPSPLTTFAAPGQTVVDDDAPPGANASGVPVLALVDTSAPAPAEAIDGKVAPAAATPSPDAAKPDAGAAAAHCTVRLIKGRREHCGATVAVRHGRGHLRGERHAHHARGASRPNRA